MKKIENINYLREDKEVYVKCRPSRHSSLNGFYLHITENEKFYFADNCLHRLELFTAEPQEPTDLPVVGNEYEFKHGNKWYLGRFNGYGSDYDTNVLFTSIRPIQQPSEEVIKVIEYLESLGYRIHK